MFSNLSKDIYHLHDFRIYLNIYIYMFQLTNI